MALDAAGIGSTAIGLVFFYAAVKGISVTASLTSIVRGQSPAALPVTNPVTAGDAPAAVGSGGGTSPAPAASNASAAQNQALAKQIAISMGYTSWTIGQAWDDWVALWNQESSWQDEANPTSSARGIAQNIDGYGPDYVQGNMTSQITWGINYIAGRYGSPVMAWAHEQANNWY